MHTRASLHVVEGQGDLHSWRAVTRPSTTTVSSPGASEPSIYSAVGMAIFATQASVSQMNVY